MVFLSSELHDVSSAGEASLRAHKSMIEGGSRGRVEPRAGVSIVLRRRPPGTSTERTRRAMRQRRLECGRVRPGRLPGADRPEWAPEHRAGAQGAPDVDPVREPRPAPGLAGVAGRGGPRAQARERRPYRSCLPHPSRSPASGSPRMGGSSSTPDSRRLAVLRTRPQAQQRVRTARGRRRGPQASNSAQIRANGGGGIRTLETGLARLAAFKAAAFNRSATPPGRPLREASRFDAAPSASASRDR